MEQIEDPVSVIKMVEDIGNQVAALQQEMPPMTMMVMSPMGPRQVDVLDDVIDTLDQCRTRIMSEYGRMLWDSADGPRSLVEKGSKKVEQSKTTINKSHRKDNVSPVPTEVLAQIFEKARAEAHRKAVENGQSIQSSTGSVERERSSGLVRRLLERASGRKIRRSDS